MNDALASPVPQITPFQAHRVRWFEPILNARVGELKLGFPVYAGPLELSRRDEPEAGACSLGQDMAGTNQRGRPLGLAGLSPPHL